MATMSTDAEKALAGKLPDHVPHWRLVIDQARITSAVAAHKYDGDGTEESPYIVTWIIDDPGNPLEFHQSRKWLISSIAAVSMLATAFNSSAFSGKFGSST